MRDFSDGSEDEPADPTSKPHDPWPHLTDVAAAAVSRMWADADGELGQFLTAEQRSHSVHERIAAASVIGTDCEGGFNVEGLVLTVYRDAVLIDSPRGLVLVMIPAITGVRDLPVRVSPPSPKLGTDLASVSALSHWLAARVTVSRRDGSLLTGDLVAVWSDCIDVTTRAVTWTVPMTAVAMVSNFGPR